MTTAADIVSTLLAHGMILGRGFTTNSTSTALATHTNILEGCKNPNCKAKDRSTHKTEDCYWPGGGKEGQFPANFGQRHTKANITVTSDSPSQHFVLSARILETPGQSGILFDDSEPKVWGSKYLLHLIFLLHLSVILTTPYQPPLTVLKTPKPTPLLSPTLPSTIN